MKIGSTPHVPTTTDTGAAGTAREAAGATAGPLGATATPVGGAGAGTDQVALSGAAAQIARLDAGGGDFDAQKVDAIRQAIREGRFSVNPEAIADRLIAEASALLSPRTH